MTALEEFVRDGRVMAAASLFPVSIEANSAGRSPVRFMAIKHPDTKKWWASAWMTTTRRNNPEHILFGEVAEVFEMTSSRIQMIVDVRADDEADPELVTITVTPSSGGCCGNRLKSWNPFGPSVMLLHEPLRAIS